MILSSVLSAISVQLSAGSQPHPAVNRRGWTVASQHRLFQAGEASEKASYHHRGTEDTEKTSEYSARLLNDGAVE